MTSRIVVLGAGFGGLELATILSEELGEDADVVLIEKGDAFVFGYSKLDVMFGRETPDAVRLPYRDFVKPGVRFANETITAIDPENRGVTTDAGEYEADVLVVALGADYDMGSTPGLAEAGNEFYSVAGAERMRELLEEFEAGRAVIGVCGAPFKCPPAPSEAALLLHDDLSARGAREQCQITFLMPLPSPVPPSPATSEALLAAFAERDIEFVPGARIDHLDEDRKLAVLQDGREYPFDLFLGVPKHRAPDVVLESGMAEEGYIPVESRTLRTRFPGVYAVGDVATGGSAQGGGVRRGRGAGRRRRDPRGDQGRRDARRLRRARLLLHRVRRGPGRPRGRRLSLRPQADWNLPGAFQRHRRREAGVRIEQARALVRSERGARCRDMTRGGGGGLAGLSAAIDLKAGGADVVVLEARDRPGGRVVQTQMPDGRLVQLGGEVIGAFHTAYRGLVEELGLTIEDAFPAIAGDDTYMLAEGRFVGKDFPWMTDEDRSSYAKVEQAFGELVEDS